MLSKCHNLILILWAVIALGTVALAEQPGKESPSPTLGAAMASTGGEGKAAGPQVGHTVKADTLHRVTRPGLYGMSQAPAGSAYGIVNDRLIRFDPATGRVLSIIRQVDEILD